MSYTQRPLPVTSDVTKPFWEAAANNKLIIQKCATCEKHQFYPRLFCIHCLAEDLIWIDCTGSGTVYSYTINHRAPNPFMKDRLPYVVAAIDLDEEVRMIANIIDSPIDQVKIGAKVHVVFEKVSEDMSLPQFCLSK